MGPLQILLICHLTWRVPAPNLLPTADLLKLDTSTDLLTCPENLTPMSFPLQPKPSYSPTQFTWHCQNSSEPLAFTELFEKRRRWLRWQGLPFVTPSPKRRETLAHPQSPHKGLLQSHSSTHRYHPKDQPRGPPVPTPSAESMQGEQNSHLQPAPSSLFLSVSSSLF